MPSLLLKFQKNPARLVIKARGLREKKTRTKGRSKFAKAKDAAKMKEAEAGNQEIDLKAKDAPCSQLSQKEDPPAKS